MAHYSDPYIDEILETNGLIFERASENGYDMPRFVRAYMTSKLKALIDKRDPIRSNLLATEQIEELSKEVNLSQLVDKSGKSYDCVLCNWIGCCYSVLQYRVRISSAEVYKRLPFETLYPMSFGLHDLDLDLAVWRVIKTWFPELRHKVYCFHNPDEPNAFLSNWFYQPFMVKGTRYTSVEQYMMAMKAITFKDTGAYNLIMQTDDFGAIKQLGRSVENFDDDTWTSVKFDIVKTGVLAKFYYNKDLRQRLMKTGDCLLAECAVRDTTWGIGLSMKDPNRFYPSKWKGNNYLGKALMDARDLLVTPHFVKAP